MHQQQQPPQVFLAPVNYTQQPSNGSARTRRRKNRHKKKDSKKKSKSIWKTWELWAIVSLTSIIWGPSVAWIQSKAFVLGLLILHDAANNVSKVLAPIAQ
jgi:hypothetical protein